MFNKKLAGEAWPCRRQWIRIAAGKALGCLCTVVFAYYAAKAIYGAVFLHMGLMEVVPFLAVLLFAVCVRAFSRWDTETAAYRIAASVQADFRRRLLEAFCFKLGPVGLAGDKAGELIVYLNEGIEALEDYYAKFLPLCASALILPPLILAVVLPFDLFSGVVFFLTAPLPPLFMFLIGRQAELANRRQWRSLAKLAAYFLDIMEGILPLKIFNQTGRQQEKLAAMNEDFRKSTMKVLRIAFLSAFVLELTATLSIALIAVSIGLRLMEGEMMFECALFLLMLAPEFYQPLRQLGSAFHQAVAANTAAVYLYGLLERPPVLAAGGGETPEKGMLAVEFQNVFYTYENDHANAVNGLSFRAEAGAYTALVGASGSGKSTIFQLLLGFMRPRSGKIYVGRHSLDALRLPELRQRIAYLPQEPYLFAMSAADNIALAKPQAAPEEIMAAAQKAGIHDFLAALPQGYQTMLGSGGRKLSGGQKQRVAVARAFLQDADVILLDEIFTGLDAQSCDAIEKALRLLAREKTVIAVTHRLETAARADRIVVIAHGAAAEKGSHEALLNQKGYYAGLWQARGEKFLEREH